MITAAIIAHTILIALILKSVVSFSLIVNINLTRIYITLTRINAKKSITNNNLYILMPDMFCKTDVEKVIPPTKASTMEAKMPSIDIYSFSLSKKSSRNAWLFH